MNEIVYSLILTYLNKKSNEIERINHFLQMEPMEASYALHFYFTDAMIKTSQRWADFLAGKLIDF
ncbi:hypothetical protein JCM19047_3198 [Bacillus sp. JCM 19047]|nr:hypothetical protein JCM19047_3198 [Bacillus sp. JCM 19047]